MRLLLDTHVLLWALGDDPRLTAAARGSLRGSGQRRAVQRRQHLGDRHRGSLRKTDFIARPDEIADAARVTGFTELVVDAGVARVASLPPHHRDPFDRLLVAQAISESVRLPTADAWLAPYSELVMLVR